MIDAQRVEALLKNRYPDLESVGQGVFRGVDRFGARDYAIRYFDLNDRLATTVDSLKSYQEEVLSPMYFSSDAQVGSVDVPYPFTSGVSATLDVEDTEPMLNVMPNPAQAYTTIRFTSKEVQTVVFSLSDAAGRLIQIFDYEAIKGMNAMLWEAVGKLPQGVYLLKMEAGGNVMTEKVVKR